MSDITDRLVRFQGRVCVSTDVEVEAAIEIDRLRAEAAQHMRRYLTAMMGRQLWREACEAAEREIQRLHDRLEKIATGDVPRSVGTAWRQDGRSSKNDTCAHHEPMYRDCSDCLSDFARAARAGWIAQPAPHKGESSR